MTDAVGVRSALAAGVMEGKAFGLDRHRERFDFASPPGPPKMVLKSLPRREDGISATSGGRGSEHRR